MNFIPKIGKYKHWTTSVNNQLDQMHCDDLLQNVLFIHRFSFIK